MKILTWNIKHGGKANRDRIIASLISNNADVIVLTEYREEYGGKIRSVLTERGWPYQISSEPPPKTNGLLVLSKYQISKVEIDYRVPAAIHRWLDFSLDNSGLRIVGIHIPGMGDRWDKKAFWEALLEFAQERINDTAMVIGDFNTGLKADTEGTPFALSEYMVKLNDLGWVDAWRYLHPEGSEFTWYSNAQNGFRLDYAYLAPGLREKLVSAVHSQRERIEKISDHAGLVVEVEIKLGRYL